MLSINFVSLTLCPYDADILASFHIGYLDCQYEGVNRNLGYTVLTMNLVISVIQKKIVDRKLYSKRFC